MSQENVEIVMAAYGAIERDDPDSGFKLTDENILWDMSRMAIPGLAGVYHGHEGLREFWTGWNTAWEGTEYLKLEPEDHGDCILVEAEQRNRGRGSGVSLEVHYSRHSRSATGRSRRRMRRRPAPKHSKPLGCRSSSEVALGTRSGYSPGRRGASRNQAKTSDTKCPLSSPRLLGPNGSPSSFSSTRPDLEVDLPVESIEHPERYPLRSRT